MNSNISAILKREIIEARGLSRLTITNAELLYRESLKEMWEFYSKNKAVLPKNVHLFRSEIISRLMKGEDVADVFEAISEVKE